MQPWGQKVQEQEWDGLPGATRGLTRPEVGGVSGVGHGTASPPSLRCDECNANKDNIM